MRRGRESVTHNFLLQICATPPRADALRPSTSILFLAIITYKNTHTEYLCKLLRRGRESNPRGPYGPAGFRNQCLQPLSHLSLVRPKADLWTSAERLSYSGPEDILPNHACSAKQNVQMI